MQELYYYRIEELLKTITENQKLSLSHETILNTLETKENIELLKNWANITWFQFKEYFTKNRIEQNRHDKKIKINFSEWALYSKKYPVKKIILHHNAHPIIEGKSILQIDWVVFASHFGYCFLAVHSKKEQILRLSFLDELLGIEIIQKGKREGFDEINELKKKFPKAIVGYNFNLAQVFHEQIFAQKKEILKPLELLLETSFFQFKVLENLAKCKNLACISYSQLAQYMGHPKATRAVAKALSKNPISYLIPCHRVVKNDGSIHKYRWGSVRKQAMLLFEFLTNK